MPDWTQSMEQTYEYYIVDPSSWLDRGRLDTVISCSISRDASAETLGSASIGLTNMLGECYIRAYLITIQNGVREKFALGTFIAQTPSSEFDGKIRKVTMDSYTPLIELKEKQPAVGYSVLKDTNIIKTAYSILVENMRGPVINTSNDEKLNSDFVSSTDDTWLSFVTDLISNANFHLEIDEMGNTMFAPYQDIKSLQHVWTYTDDNSSIIEPDISMEHDLYGVPNVVEVLYTSGLRHYYARVVNDDPNSPTSTISRGREIIYREVNPSFLSSPSQSQINQYANQLLRNKSTVEYQVTYTHGYCPVRLGDCVMLDYKRAGLRRIKAKVISQTIECKPGCPVNETAVFTENLWEG